MKVRDKSSKGDTSEMYVSSGSTLLNLACSGKPHLCYKKGHYYFFVGDSSSGKTFMVLTSLAEATKNPAFDDYLLVYDAPENGALMDWEYYYGAEAAKRIMSPPKGDSEYVEDFYDSLQQLMQSGKSVIYIADSMDAFDTREDEKKDEEVRKAREANKETSGTYGMAKAKINSRRLKKMMPLLKKTGSILIIISQTRDNIQPGTYEKKTRAGGKALRFYATLEIWTSTKEKLSKTVKGKKRQYGIVAQAKIKKNRIQGKERVVDIQLLHGYGVDDIGTCIDYLLEEKHWSGTAAKLTAPEFDFTGKKERLIADIEEGGKEKKLRRIVTSVWNDIEERLKPDRKKRYT